jgi:hypothetical protein
MNPVYYLQTDKRWSGISYSAPGESTTIGKAGCGPTSAAMVIASLKDPSVTPATTAKWSLDHGYKALRQGTYYSYFVPQLKAYGIPARQLNQYNNWHSNDQAKLRTSVRAHLNAGRWLITCMGKGTWTSSGHFVLAYGMDSSGRVLINDPASTATHRTHGDMNTYLNEAKYWWLIEPPVEKGGDDLTKDEVQNMIDESIAKVLAGENLPASDWAVQEGIVSAGVSEGITDGTRPQGYAKREEVWAMVLRALKVVRK